jgi:uncharacterized peroxidase-related enzyme
VKPAEATGRAKGLLDGVKVKLGRTPNLFTTLANAPAALEGYLELSGALARGQFSAKLREQIALAVAQASGCHYCLSAHTAVGKVAGLSEGAIADARRGSAGEPKAQAALVFAQAVVEKRGQVSDAELEAARRAGLTDAEITEVVAHVALNLLTNYINLVADTEVDFPKVALALETAA